MRSALLTSVCAAVCCAATTSATAICQAPQYLQVTPEPLAISVTHSTLVAAATSKPEFSTSTATLSDSDGAGNALPDAPTAPALDVEGQAGVGHAPSTQPIAPKYAGSILPGQGAIPLSAGDKIIFAIRDTTSPYAFLSRVVSATYSQAVDSQPHYGQGWAPYGQRIGAAYARGTVQDLATEAVFDNVFKDDPRYYVLGRQHKIINRAIYAATRVVITRTDSGHNTLNAPLLLGYAAAAGANMAYYPKRDRDFGDAATGYAGSLGGGVLGFEVSEFLPDILRITHLHRD